MPPSLNSLPYEVLSTIIEEISLEDVVNLARSSSQLRFLEREDNICRKILEVRHFVFHDPCMRGSMECIPSLSLVL
jgi:hypothetical protein